MWSSYALYHGNKVIKHKSIGHFDLVFSLFRDLNQKPNELIFFMDLNCYDNN